MSDDNVVSLFGKRSTPTVASTEPPKMQLRVNKQIVDQRSVELLNNVIETALQGGVSGLVIMGTRPSGLPQFWISVPEDIDPQIASTKYLGQTVVLQKVLTEVVFNGANYEPDDRGAA